MRFYALFFLLLMSGGLQSAELALVAQRDMPEVSLSREDVRDLFLGKRRLYAGALVLSPLDVADEALRERFYQAVAGLSSNRVRGYWAQQVFTGRSRPPREVNIAEAREVVAHEKGLVTYLNLDQVPAGSRILMRLSTP